MAKLHFRYGAMGSSKTANALMVEYNYRERGKKALLVKPGIDSRDGGRTIRSRIGLEKEGIYLEELVEKSDNEIREYDCIIVDEAQFATKSQVEVLVHIVDDLDIPVICYGLRTDFQNHLFPGSARLIAIADTIREIKTVCWCGKKATCNARVYQNSIVRSGEQVQLGDNDSYVALCRKHFKLGMLRPETVSGS